MRLGGHCVTMEFVFLGATGCLEWAEWHPHTPRRCVHILTPGSWEYGLVWEKGLCRWD